MIRKAHLTRWTAAVGIVASLAAGAAPMTRAHASVAGPGSSCSWNLYTDFVTGSKHANPNPDSCGNSNVWYYLQNSSSSPATLSSASEIPNYTDNFRGVSDNLQGWQNPGSANEDLPVVLKNTGNTFTFGSVTVPATSILVHPGSSTGNGSDGSRQDVIVGWRSPINGNVDITSMFSSDDGNGGNGIAWSVDRGSSVTFQAAARSSHQSQIRPADSTPGVLASGSYGDGNNGKGDSGTGGDLTNVAVTQGQFLYFVVDPKGDFSYDSTRLDVTITQSASPVTPPSNTPELGSGELLATGLLPIAAIMFYRRRRDRRAI